jgi:tetratricopeptide (TPR) repeat protein/transcriptional regulator with XRE-family HTH domain
LAGPSAFGALLRSLRVAAGLTQEELAEGARLSVRSVSDLERGVNQTARKETARLLANALRLVGDARTEFEAVARGGQPAPAKPDFDGGHALISAGAASATRTLPRDIASYTGRGEALAALAASASGGGVVGIHAIGGMAGVGKTAFAVHAAHLLAGQFPDGQLFLPLHGHTPAQRPVDPAEALASLLLTAGVDAARIPPGLENRAARWRDYLAGKRILLVLDDAVSSEQVQPLLPGGNSALVLITSRRHLTALDDAQAISLDTLPPGEAAELLVRLAGRPGLRPQDDGVRELVRRGGYLPLAVGMLARQLHHHPAWTIADLTDEMSAARNRLDVLETENLSVAAAFDLSYSELTGEQQRMFRYLGLHLGADFDVHAAAALADDDLTAARRTLTTLYDHYLLTELAHGRYRMHDLIREYASRAAEASLVTDKDAARRRLLDYYLHTARAADGKLGAHLGAVPAPPPTRPAFAPVFADRDAAVAWMTAERLNLHAAAETAAAAGQTAYVVDAAVTMQRFLSAHGYWNQAIALDEAAVRYAADDGDRFRQACALTLLGSAHQAAGDNTAAADSLDQALRLFTDLGDRLGQAEALMNIGAVQRNLAELPAAIASQRAALTLYREAGHAEGEAASLHHLGQAQLTGGDQPAAMASFQEAVDLGRRTGNVTTEAHALSSMGLAYRRTGQHAAAIACARQALDLARRLGERYMSLAALNNIGISQMETGENRAAVDTFTQVLREAEELGARHAQASALNNLGQAHLALADYEIAAASARRALAIHRELGRRREQALALGVLGLVQRETGDPAAEASFAETLRICRETGDRLSEAETLNNMAELPGPAQTQRAYASEALAIARDIAARQEEARALGLIGLSYLAAADTTEAAPDTTEASGDAAEAARLLRESLALYQQVDVPVPDRIQQALRTSLCARRRVVPCHRACRPPEVRPPGGPLHHFPGPCTSTRE